jgi:hypothetical protein
VEAEAGIGYSQTLFDYPDSLGYVAKEEAETTTKSQKTA